MSETKGIPTEEELDKLPRWALVAFAARCARRVQPLFVPGDPKRAQEHLEVVDRAITIGERAAAAAHADPHAHAFDAADSADAADAFAAAAAFAAADAAHAAADADALASAFAARAAARAAAAAAHDTRVKPAFVASVRRDFEVVLQAQKRESWTDATALPPEFFGPLWPDGEPPGWGDLVRNAKKRIAEVMRRAVSDQKETEPDAIGPGQLVLVWDAQLLDKLDYVELVTALGDVVRSEGGVGIKRIGARGHGVPVESQVPV